MDPLCLLFYQQRDNCCRSSHQHHGKDVSFFVTKIFDVLFLEIQQKHCHGHCHCSDRIIQHLLSSWFDRVLMMLLFYYITCGVDNKTTTTMKVHIGAKLVIVAVDVCHFGILWC